MGDASEAVNACAGDVARSHAARGTAAMKLGQLAEAVSSWETAELLGGVPEAAQEAEKCRQRLQEFLAALHTQRDSAGQKGSFAAGSASAPGSSGGTYCGQGNANGRS